MLWREQEGSTQPVFTSLEPHLLTASVLPPDLLLLSTRFPPFTPQLLDSIMALESPQARKLGCMIMAAAPRIDQLWIKCTPTMLMDWLAKTQV